MRIQILLESKIYKSKNLSGDRTLRTADFSDFIGAASNIRVFDSLRKFSYSSHSFSARMRVKKYKEEQDIKGSMENERT